MLKKMQIYKLIKKILENKKILKFSNIEKENNFKVKEKQTKPKRPEEKATAATTKGADEPKQC